MGVKLSFFERFLDGNFYLSGKYYINLCRVESISSEAVVTFDDGSSIYLSKKTYVKLKQRFAGFMLEGF